MILVLLTFTACGAEINTEMKFDKDFKGERTVAAYIKSADLRSYVSTGADGVEDVIKKYIPDSLSYNRSDYKSGDVEFTFIIKFNDLEDYIKKVTQILNKNPDNTITAQISYENENNEFIKKLMFEENFTSNDLLAWLVYGLKAENTVNYSSVRDWMETGNASLTIDNQEYDVYDYLYVKKSESTSFESINVFTEIIENGNFKRNITFLMNERNIKLLKDRGLNVAEYLKNISPKNANFEEVKEGELIKYIVSFESKTSQEISISTNKLFNRNNTVFNINYSSYKNNKNTIRIDVEEYIDASYYLSSVKDSMYCDIYLHNDMQIDFSNSSNIIDIRKTENNQVFRYDPNFKDMYKFTFSLPIEFKSASLNIDVNKNIITERLALIASGNLPESITKIIEANIKSSIESDKIKLDVKKEKSDISYTLSLNGTPEEVSHEFKGFLKNYIGNSVNHEILRTELKSKSAFKTEHSLSVVADLQKLNAKNIEFYCKPSNHKKFEFIESSNTSELDNSTNKGIASKVNGGIIRFNAIETGTKTSSVVVLIITIIIIAVIALFIIANRDRLKLMFRNTSLNQKTYVTSNKKTVITNTNEEQEEDEYI
jgi:hypothetical protein